MSNSAKFQKETLAFNAKAVQVDYFLQKGIRIIYEGEEGEIIRVRPFLVIRTKHRVICGALQKEIEYVRRQNTH